jgi:ribosomal protein S27AE
MQDRESWAMLVVPAGRRREEQGDDMGTDFPSDTSTSTPVLQREVCDKCGSRMTLQSSAYGFERWECPKCHQIVGIDRDPEVGGRFQIDRGQPWNYSPDAFKN